MGDDRHLRVLAAALLLVGGAVHVQLSFDDYGTVDIDRAFALNGAASALVAAYLVVRRDLAGPLAGAAVSTATLAAFGLSRVGDGLMDFRATGLDPSPQALLTLVSELAALVVLGVIAARTGTGPARPAAAGDRRVT